MCSRRRASSASSGWSGPRRKPCSEIEVIERMGFPGYFLIVWDFISYARENGIPVGPGRGSAAGSLVGVRAAHHRRRPARSTTCSSSASSIPSASVMPDIDIDFCMDGRGEVIEYVRDKYGRDNVAQIITFGTLAAKRRDPRRRPRARAAVRRRRQDRQAGPRHDASRSPRRRATSTRLRGRGARTTPRCGRSSRSAAARGAGPPRRLHAAGVVITPRAARRTRAALQDQPRRDRHAVGHGRGREDGPAQDGLPRPAHADGHRRRAQDPALPGHRRSTSTQVPLDDPEVFRLFCEGRTNGIFQFESGGMQDLLRARPADALRGPRRVQRPLPPRRAVGGHGRRVHPAQDTARRRCATSCPRSSRSSRRPTASSSTRSR